MPGLRFGGSRGGRPGYAPSWMDREGSRGGRASSRRGTSRRGSYNSGTAGKHSGAKIKDSYQRRDGNGGKERVDAPCINAWKVQDRKILSLVAVPCSDTTTKSKNSEKWVCTLTLGKTGRKETETGFYNPETGKLTIPDRQMVVNPKAPNGGYFGTFVK
ncbi:hypothetical protein F0P96_04410 [Hymenobacter busanensis]|uniref:Uncharacterized protein n=2 Tax=Hymenobacter busanensis TaxID=2607656 RepID=A0AA88FMJ1_9BACT|nr:hypothetical protein [Hymenobacter busanensis]KAA9339865.1 hypothetical protein F0P96_04410 [Hymenobacter busanensis]